MALKALIGETVLNKDKIQVDVSSLLPSGGVLGLYFSAHWCPPCRAFTPELALWYNNIKSGPNGSKFEIVFVSCDSDEESFSDYFAEMPWHALPYSDRETEVRGLYLLLTVEWKLGHRKKKKSITYSPVSDVGWFHYMYFLAV